MPYLLEAVLQISSCRTEGLISRPTFWWITEREIIQKCSVGILLLASTLRLHQRLGRAYWSHTTGKCQMVPNSPKSFTRVVHAHACTHISTIQAHARAHTHTTHTHTRALHYLTGNCAGGTAFECQNGYAGRRCSSCAETWSSIGGMCVLQCNNDWRDYCVGLGGTGGVIFTWVMLNSLSGTPLAPHFRSSPPHPMASFITRHSKLLFPTQTFCSRRI